MRYERIMLSSALVAILTIAGCGQSGSAPESAAENQSGKAATEAAAPARAPEPKVQEIVLPAGTAIAVTVDQAVSSETNNAGDHFAASVAAPVMAGEKQAIPRGAKVSGMVTEAKSAGRFKGNAELTLALDSVTINGKTYDLKTSKYTEVTKSRGKRTAITTGIGAAAGAAIGALAGGGKGAAIGAGAGAGAGATGAAVTGERDVELPAETKVNFKLTQPVTIEVPNS